MGSAGAGRLSLEQGDIHCERDHFFCKNMSIEKSRNGMGENVLTEICIVGSEGQGSKIFLKHK